MINSNLNSVAGNVRSYDLGNQPFKHDVGRGKWDTIWDFYAVALSHCLGFRHLTLFFLISKSNVVGIFLSYLLGLFILVLPLYYMQMFLGQFSSSGLISAFRIAPLFKVIGYVSLFLNIMTCTYLMVSAAFPLSIVFDSIQTELPWTHCNNSYNTHKFSLQVNDTNDIETTFPIDEYFDHITGRTISNGYDGPFLWRIILCTLLVWLLIGGILSKGAEMFGKIFRFVTIISLVCILLTTIRSLFTIESWESILYSFSLNAYSFKHMIYVLLSPLLTMTIFGVGWGNILTIASYNNFKTDIGKTSMIVCAVQMIIFLLALVNDESVEIFSEKHRYTRLNTYQLDVLSNTFITYGFYYSQLNWSNFWTITFFFSIFLTQFSEGAIQTLSILTAIFDEFEYTRVYKSAILCILIAFFALSSIIFCTHEGISSVIGLYLLAGAYKAIIILIELFIILWVYGRLRFQRDVKFMTGKEFQTWIIWTMRILTPIFAIASFMMYLVQSFFFSILNGVGVTVTFLMIKIIPILCIPVYVICKIYKSSGSILNRIRFLCRPNDWYPADPVEHQNYETYLGNSDMSNELVHDDGNTYF